MIETSRFGRVLKIALKTATEGPMREVAEAKAVTGSGLEGSAKPSPRRGVTLISAAQWSEAMRELNAALPWHTRRANILIEAPRLGPLIGSRCRLGEAVLAIHGETKPCHLMDHFHAGLQEALKPDCRGGVICEVIEGGRIRVGDELIQLTPW